MINKVFNFEARIGTKFIALAVIFFIALLFRNSSLYPIVFGDEFTYSQLSRLVPLQDAYRPNYLYFVIYHFTNVCGDGFLDCARILNAIFFVGSAPFIYLSARRLYTIKISTIVASLSLLGPVNSYTVYFMPESFYFFSFWLLTWFILGLDNTSSLKSWSIAGILLGLSALVKPHTLFFLPAIIAYVLYISKENGHKWVTRALVNASSLVTVTFLVKLFIGYLLAGRAGITLFGPSYTTIATAATSNLEHYLKLLVLSASILKGHILAIFLMYGMPIAVVIYAAFNSSSSDPKIREHQKISFFTLVILINLILVVGLFSATVVGSGPYESAGRLHMRYYDFALPLFFIIAASQMSVESVIGKLRWRVLTAFTIGTVILYATYTHLAPYSPSIVDSPELRGFTYNSFVFYSLSAISFITLLLWIKAPQFSSKIFVYFFMPLAVIFSSFYINKELRQWSMLPDVSVKAGIFAKHLLSDEDLSNLVVVGSDPGSLLKSLFYIDNSKASLQIISKVGHYDLSNPPPPTGKDWLLVIGENSIPENTFFQIQMNGFTLVHVANSNTVDFKQSSWPGTISNAQGLSSAEPSGTWSSSDAVSLKFSKPLPEKFIIHLVAAAFGPNVGKKFVAHMGDKSIEFTLDASASTSQGRLLIFDNPTRSSIIKFDIPLPTSPKELGMNDDERRLGILLTKLQIISLDGNTSDFKNSKWPESQIIPSESSTISFKQSSWPGLISSAQGLSSTEQWGTQSLGDAVILKFSKPLPAKFIVNLVAAAFGPNVGKKFVAHVGNNSIKFTLTATANNSQGTVLVFDNPNRSNIFKIDIPVPTSPKELGLNSDERRLGISLTELRITPL